MTAKVRNTFIQGDKGFSGSIGYPGSQVTNAPFIYSAHTQTLNLKPLGGVMVRQTKLSVLF